MCRPLPLVSTQRALYAKYGYCTAKVGSLLIVSLNTVIYTPAAAQTASDPLGQFAWLTNTLRAASAANQQVYVFIPPVLSCIVSHDFLACTFRSYITGHMPPTLDLSLSGTPKNFWLDKFTATYVGILQSYNDVVVAQFFGATHQNGFVASDQGVPLLFTTGSVAPIVGTMPTFKLFTATTPTMALLDYANIVGDYTVGSTPSAPSAAPLAISWTTSYVGRLLIICF